LVPQYRSPTRNTLLEADLMGANRAGAAPTQPPLPYSGGPVFLGKFLLGEPGAGGRGRNREMESSVTSASLWDRIKRARSISPCLARSGPGGRPWRRKSWGMDIDSRSTAAQLGAPGTSVFRSRSRNSAGWGRRGEPASMGNLRHDTAFPSSVSQGAVLQACGWGLVRRKRFVGPLPTGTTWRWHHP
jgi:hypothetical protein